MAYFTRSTPTRIPSSISVGETYEHTILSSQKAAGNRTSSEHTLSPNPTTNLAIWRMLIMYLVSSPVGIPPSPEGLGAGLQASPLVYVFEATIKRLRWIRV